MWRRHWGLTRNPFDGRIPPYVPTPTHAEAVARLVHAVDSAERSARLVAEPGLGKTVVLEQALNLARDPSRRIARIAAPLDTESFYANLAERLGRRVEPGTGVGRAWRALSDAVRLCQLQGLSVVFAVDDAHLLPNPADLDRLRHLDPDARITLLQVQRPVEDAVDTPFPTDWPLPVRLVPLTRAETANYLDVRISAADRVGPIFTPRAVTQLHALSGGVPRGVDRLAALALMAGAVRGLEMVTPDVIDGAARECNLASTVPAIPRPGGWLEL
jgi:type II secretory pathway predicted ATPase ExeA